MVHVEQKGHFIVLLHELFCSLFIALYCNVWAIILDIFKSLSSPLTDFCSLSYPSLPGAQDCQAELHHGHSCLAPHP